MEAVSKSSASKESKLVSSVNFRMTIKDKTYNVVSGEPIKASGSDKKMIEAEIKRREALKSN